MVYLRISLVSTCLLFAIGCGGSGYATAPSPDPAPPAPSGQPSASSFVSIPAGAAALGTAAFSPDDADVAVGSTVTWTNTDSVAHTSTSDASGWNSGTLNPGARFSFTFQTAGRFQYHCAIHPGMVGSVIVH